MWFGAWQFDSVGRRAWEEELKIGDEIIVLVGASIETEVAADWYILEGTFSFFRTRTADIGIGLGVHAVDLESTLKGRVHVGDQDLEVINQEFDTLAPLPNVLLYSYWKFADCWRLTARAGWFGLSYDNYDGEMTNLHALLRYDRSDRWAIEAGYQFVKLDVEVEKVDHMRVFDVDFDGLMAVVRFNF